MTEIHFIECDGKINGRRHTWFAERDCDRANFSNTVDDILSGQVEHVRRVYAASLDATLIGGDGVFQDVSRQVAQEIANRLQAEPMGGLLDFLENHLGCARVASLCRELEAA